MKLSEKEKSTIREQFRRMSLSEKLQYILSYYKAPIFLTVTAIAILVSAAVRFATGKTPVLYLAGVNLSWGSELEESLTDGFLEAEGYDRRKQEVYLYSDLYISDDPADENHAYAYASQIKTMAAINAGEMDVVLMNQESYDIFSQNGLLLELEELLSGTGLETGLTENTVVISDNTIEVTLGEASEVERVTKQVLNGLEVSGFPLFRSAGMDGKVWIGVIANSPRKEAARAYIEYACS